MASALSSNCTEKPENTGITSYKNDFERDAAGTKIKHRFVADWWDKEQIYGASLQAEGNTWRDVVLCDHIPVNEVKSDDPRYTCTKTERPTL